MKRELREWKREEEGIRYRELKRTGYDGKKKKENERWIEIAKGARTQAKV